MAFTTSEAESNQSDIKLQYCLANSGNWEAKNVIRFGQVYTGRPVRFKIIFGTRFEC